MKLRGWTVLRPSQSEQMRQAASGCSWGPTPVSKGPPACTIANSAPHLQNCRNSYFSRVVPVRVPRILAQDGGHSTSNASGLLKLGYILRQHLKTRREDGFWPSGRQLGSYGRSRAGSW